MIEIIKKTPKTLKNTPKETLAERFSDSVVSLTVHLCPLALCKHLCFLREILILQNFGIC